MDVSLKTGSRKRGFSLLELLIVIAIMGVVVTAVYSLYLTTDRTSTTSEEVVDVQQNLRVALNSISRDLRMAGFLCSAGPIITANSTGVAPTTILQIRTVSASQHYGRITNVNPNPVGTATPFTVTLGPTGISSLFSTGDYVRIVRASNDLEPFAPSTTFRVTNIVSGTDTLTLDNFTAPTNPVTLQSGDMVVRVTGSAATVPETISYQLQRDSSSDSTMYQLVRTVTGVPPAVVADKLYYVAGSTTDLGLQLVYLDNTGAQISAPVIGSTNLANIAAVRIILTGATDATKTGQANYSGRKIRQVESTVQLRND